MDKIFQVGERSLSIVITTKEKLNGGRAPLFIVFPGGGATEKTRPKNNTIKPPSTLSVSCMKILRELYGPTLSPAADAHE